MRLALIEDNKIFRDSLEEGLSIFEDCDVVYSLANALQIEEAFGKNPPDVALIDINMPGINGIAAVSIIQEKYPNVHSIMLTVNVDMDLVIKSLEAGAKGYLVKDKDSIQKIVESIRIICSGNYNEEFPLNGTLANKLLQYFTSKNKSIDTKLNNLELTSRQKEILKLLHEGMSYKKIANSLFISTETLNTHIKNIYSKLNIKSRGEINSIIN